ncbi:hypothetical protein KP509_1Z037400 [Ceratopteris richardii]|nr:hypothetical protein KP509_1Z037400 [Ceratopteris richardii]
MMPDSGIHSNMHLLFLIFFSWLLRQSESLICCCMWTVLGISEAFLGFSAWRLLMMMYCHIWLLLLFHHFT